MVILQNPFAVFNLSLEYDFQLTGRLPCPLFAGVLDENCDFILIELFFMINIVGEFDMFLRDVEYEMLQ